MSAIASGPALLPGNLPGSCTSQPPRRALRAPVAAAIFMGEASLLDGGAEHLAPLAALEDDLIAAGEDLERLPDLLETIERHRPRLVERLEVGRVDEVGHRDAVHLETERLDRVGALVSVDHLGIRSG